VHATAKGRVQGPLSEAGQAAGAAFSPPRGNPITHHCVTHHCMTRDRIARDRIARDCSAGD
ncbi:MAG: hypothetical protein ACKOBM_12010, partial [Gammaproteobacteria bacterium]